MISEGKLAVILGIEVSKLFDCGVANDRPECTKEEIDRRLDEVHGLGVRQMELINKFDNALGGVAGDSGDTGLVDQHAATGTRPASSGRCARATTSTTTLRPPAARVPRPQRRRA